LSTIAIAGSKDENPRQAGKSSIYVLDVKSQVDDGYGQLMINVAKKTFVFNGENFTPYGRFKIQIARETGLELLASGHSTRTGNLHIQGKWNPASVIPTLGMVGTYWYYDPAYGFKGQQEGFYLAHFKIRYSNDGGTTWHTTEKETGTYALDKTFSLPVSNFTDSTHVINKGDLIQFKVRVEGGDDVWTDAFTYVPDADPMFCWPYLITHGSTFNAWIEYWSDDCQRCLDTSNDTCNYWYTWGEDIP
jgi:hypothetical protein